MALPGGTADKFGGEYEAWWTLFRITELLQGKAQSLRIEPFEADGAELWVQYDEKRYFDQVKFRSGGSWTVRKLIREQVLTRLAAHYRSGAHIVLILSSGSQELEQLIYWATAAETLGEFESSLPNYDGVKQLSAAWGTDLETTWSFLQRTEVRREDFRRLVDYVQLVLGQAVVGDTTGISAALHTQLFHWLQTTITAQDVWNFLSAKGFDPRPSLNPGPFSARLRSTLQRQVEQVESFTPSLGKVRRREVEELVQLLSDPDEAPIIIVHGRAGSGKSSLVTDAVLALSNAGHFVGAVRLDRVPTSTATAKQLGECMDLPASPVLILHEFAVRSRPGILLVDQLDAVSTYSGRMPDVYDAVKDVVNQVRLIGGVKLVLAVRTIDLEEDPRLRQLALSEDSVAVEIGELEVADVEKYLTTAGIDPTSVAPVTLRLLRLPIQLSVFSQLEPDRRTHPFSSLADLYASYTSTFRKGLERDGLPNAWPAIASTLVERMNLDESLSAPAAAVDDQPVSVIEWLISANVLVVDGSRLSFFHETYFDFLFARSFAFRGEDLVNWFAGSGQSLFRRSQLRQVLTFIASQEPSAFVEEVELIATSTLRPHLVSIAYSLLASFHPLEPDWYRVEKLLERGDSFQGRLLDLLRTPSWFLLADSLGRVEALITRDDVGLTVAHNVTRLVNDFPARILELISQGAADDDSWVEVRRSIVSVAEADSVTAYVIAQISNGAFDTKGEGFNPLNTSMFHRLTEMDPARAIQLVRAHLERALNLANADRNDLAATEVFSNRANSDIRELAVAAPAEFVAELNAMIIALARPTLSEDGSTGRERWRYRFKGTPHGLEDELYFAFDKALSTLARIDFAAAHPILERLAEEHLDSLDFLACRAQHHGDADSAVNWLLYAPSRLEIGWSDSHRWESRRLIRFASVSCSNSKLIELESALVAYTPDNETRPDGLRRRGLGSLELLTALPANRVSATVTSRILQLRRKFPKWAPEGPRGILGGALQSPISSSAALLMRDENWISAMRKYAGNDGPRFVGSGVFGGAHELSQVLSAQAGADPSRFVSLGLALDSNISADYTQAILRGVSGVVEQGDLLPLLLKFRREHPESAGQVVTSALETNLSTLSDGLFDLLLDLLTDENPNTEYARVRTRSGFRFGGDLVTAGLNSTRGAAAASLGRVLFSTPARGPGALVAIRAIVEDPILAVRAMAAEPVLAYFNVDREIGLDLAQELLESSPSLLTASPVVRLLKFAVLWAPERFAPHLADALRGEDQEAAGSVWVNALVNGVLTEPAPLVLGDLTPAARKGAANALSGNPSLDPDLIFEMFDDPNLEVREHASAALRGIETLPRDQQLAMVERFVTSRSFPTHMRLLLDSLADSHHVLPPASLQACKSGVSSLEAARGNEWGDALATGDLVKVVLRLYQQGHSEVREECLNLVDRMVQLNLWGLDRALERD